MTATIHDLDHPDDIIETRTGLTAIDIDPKVVARRMRRKTWKDRALFLDNVLFETLERWGEMKKYLVGGSDEEDRYSAWVWLSVMANISAIIDAFGIERPECDDSAAFFSVALSSAHTTAARQYANSQNKHPNTMFGTVENEWLGIRVLYYLTLVTRPGETWVALNGGVPDDPGFEFRVPDSDIDFGDEPDTA